MTQVNMSMVGMTNVTVTMFNDEQDDAAVYNRWLDNNANALPGDAMPAKSARSAHFHVARKRLAAQGAAQAKVFPV